MRDFLILGTKVHYYTEDRVEAGPSFDHSEAKAELCETRSVGSP